VIVDQSKNRSFKPSEKLRIRKNIQHTSVSSEKIKKLAPLFAKAKFKIAFSSLLRTILKIFLDPAMDNGE